MSSPVEKVATVLDDAWRVVGANLCEAMADACRFKRRTKRLRKRKHVLKRRVARLLRRLDASRSVSLDLLTESRATSEASASALVDMRANLDAARTVSLEHMRAAQHARARLEAERAAHAHTKELLRGMRQNAGLA